MITPNVYQHWDPLKVCMVGKSYPPEFYSWIENPKARSAMERIAQETEEDFQSLIKILHSFGVKTIRPEVSGNHEEYYNRYDLSYAKPPMTPRDWTGAFGNKFFVTHAEHQSLKFYNSIKDQYGFPDLNNFAELFSLPQGPRNKFFELLGFDHRSWYNEKKFINHWKQALDKHNVDYTFTNEIIATAHICRVGKDLYYPLYKGETEQQVKDKIGNEYRINFYNGHSHGDSCFCPVVPGLIVSLNGYLNYSKTFPDWEVVELPNQSWDKVSPFLNLKRKNKGKWWVPGEENNDALTECVEDWLGNWVGYVEETVFDVNMLVIDEKNVICNNYNKKVFDAFERYNITPHICNFRHRYFWDGGIHCITSDILRDGEMKDYFPER